MRISDWSSDVCSSDLIAVKQLVLQRARTGRHQRALAGHQRRHEVRIGLAGAGAGFDDQAAVVLVSLCDGSSHALLRHARREDAEIGKRNRDRSEARRVGQEGVSKWRHRWSMSTKKKNNRNNVHTDIIL